MNYSPKEFSNMLVNPYEIEDNKDITEGKYNSIFNYKEFAAKIPIDKQKVLRYICYAYDKNSPFQRETDTLKRKVNSAKFAKIKPSDIELLVKGENKDIAQMIIRYIRQQKNIDFATLVAMYENYWNNLSLVMSSDIFDKDKDILKDAQGKAKLSSQLLENLGEIKSLANKVFYGETELLYSVDDAIKSDNEMEGIPERMAKQWDKL